MHTIAISARVRPLLGQVQGTRRRGQRRSSSRVPVALRTSSVKTDRRQECRTHVPVIGTGTGTRNARSAQPVRQLCALPMSASEPGLGNPGGPQQVELPGQAHGPGSPVVRTRRTTGLHDPGQSLSARLILSLARRRQPICFRRRLRSQSPQSHPYISPESWTWGRCPVRSQSRQAWGWVIEPKGSGPKTSRGQVSVGP